MQNFEPDLSRRVPRSYEDYFGGKMRKYDFLTVHVRFLVEHWIWPGLIRIRGGKGRSSEAIGREEGSN